MPLSPIPSTLPTSTYEHLVLEALSGIAGPGALSYHPPILSTAEYRHLVLTALQYIANNPGGGGGSQYVLKAGDTMTGKLNLPASTTANSSLNIPYGVDPTSPNLGDIWTTSTGIKIRRGTSGSPETATVAVLGRNTFTGAQTVTASITSGSVLDVTNTQAAGTPSVAATFTATGTAPAVTITQNGNGGGLKIVNPTGTGESLRVEDESPESTPFVVSATGKVGIGVEPDASVSLSIDSTGVKFSDGSIQTTAPTGGTPTDVQVFTSSGTWTKPANARKVVVELVGGGGGGASGSKRPIGGSTNVGGGGGGAGGFTKNEFNPNDLTSTVSITIGAGGDGGPSQTTNGAQGNAGVNGFPTIFGNYADAKGGAAGGASGASSSGGSGGNGSFAGSAGGNSSNTVNASTGGLGAFISGGGGGGGIDVANGFLNAGNGGVVGSSPIFRSSAGNSTTPPNVVTHGYTAPLGFGGGGGFGSTSGNAQNGANGGLYGGGGGGGGAAKDGIGNSGAGGDGADGIAIITTYF